MKKLNFLSASLLFILSAFIFSSCSTDELEAIVEDLIPESSQLTAPTNTEAVLQASEVDNVFETYTWTEASFGDEKANNYELSIYYGGGVVVLKETTELSAAVTVGEMDAAIKEAAGSFEDAGDAVSFKIGVVSHFNNEVVTVSDPHDLTVTTIAVVEDNTEEPAEEPGEEDNSEEPTDRVAHENDGLWGVIGDATGSWDADQDLLYNAETEVYSITLDLVLGNIKFRKSDDWAVNLGGTTEALVHDGDNIAITEAGNYTIELTVDESGDSAVGTFTMTKN
ncbi:SusF/SusE family outer membrane protein [Flammeovirga pectinis]|nr:SusF/SusE family outer membrane protein [Flammeovirga pectinis]